MKKLMLLIMVFVFEKGIAQINLQLDANLPYPTDALANISGYVDSLGNEYALVGTQSGVDIVDVSIPANPVSRFQVPGPNSEWREIKTYRKYAYITTEGGDGLIIADLSHLPDTVYYKHYYGDGAITGLLNSIHALHCDTAMGYLYLYGSNVHLGNSLFFNLSDPWNPVYSGEYSLPGGGRDAYVHDGYVLNDTMYEAHVYGGFFTVVDVRNKSNPVLLATQTTPTAFTHNTWLSDDHHTLFTTDENTNSYLTAYDISDLANIKELSRFQTAPGTGAIVHNTHILNDYAVTSWYVEGVVIVDESRPRNPIQVAKYDTYAGTTIDGFNGDWGVYPFLPSGTIVASDIDNGLFVFTPTYKRGCYLEGTVKDSITLASLNGALVEIMSTSITRLSDILGEFRTGTVDSGLYDIRVSKGGYITKIITGVHLQNGILTPLNVLLIPRQTFAFSGSVTDSLTGSGVPNASVVLAGPDFTYTTTSDVNGLFSFPGVLIDSYKLYTGKWGYHPSCDSLALSQGMLLSAVISPGYYDDFNIDQGWTVTGTSPNAWERGDPIGTYTPNNTEVNPENDAATDCGPNCFVTDNGGDPYSSHDVDNGNTILTSPVFDATLYLNPTVNYYRRYMTFSGTPNDTMIIRLSNGITTVDLERIAPDDFSIGMWLGVSFPIQSFLTPTANMQLSVEVMDNPPGNIVEGAFDQFEITGILLSKIDQLTIQNELSVYPNPFNSEILMRYSLKDYTESAKFIVRDITGRIVYQQKLAGSTGTIQLGKELLPGIYIAYLNNGSDSTVKKIVKE